MTRLISEIAELVRMGATAQAIELAQQASAQFGMLWLLQARFRYRSQWAFRGIEKISSQLPMPEVEWFDDEAEESA